MSNRDTQATLTAIALIEAVARGDRDGFDALLHNETDAWRVVALMASLFLQLADEHPESAQKCIEAARLGALSAEE